MGPNHEDMDFDLNLDLRVGDMDLDLDLRPDDLTTSLQNADSTSVGNVGRR